MKVIMLRRGAKKRPIQQMVWLQGGDIQSADDRYNLAPPVHNVQHMLGDVELDCGESGDVPQTGERCSGNVKQKNDG